MCEVSFEYSIQLSEFRAFNIMRMVRSQIFYIYCGIIIIAAVAIFFRFDLRSNWNYRVFGLLGLALALGIAPFYICHIRAKKSASYVRRAGEVVMSIGSDGLAIDQDLGKSTVNWSAIKCIHFTTMFIMIDCGPSQILIPKRCLDTDELSRLVDILQNVKCGSSEVDKLLHGW